MSRTKRRIANLDPAESYKPQLVTTQWLDNDGVVRTTVHEGNFSPSPQEPTLVFVPAQFCDEFYMMRIMEDRKENPQQVENGSYKYLRAAFLSPNSQQSATGKSTIDGNEQNSSVIGRISVKTSTISDFSEDFQGFLEPYIDNYEIIFTDAQIEDWLESGTHTIKVEYNGEESETMQFTVASTDYMYFEAAEANSTVSMISMLETAPDLEYSRDGVTWQEWQHTTAEGTHTFDTLTLTAVGDRVYLRGDNPNGLFDAENMQLSYFHMTGQIKAGGSVTSIIDGDGVSLTEIPASCFGPLFAGSSDSEPNTCLLTAPSFGNATIIGEFGCYYMFMYCTNLISGPDMRLITTIKAGGCIGMLGGCSSLHTVSDMESLTSVENGGCQTMCFDTGINSAANMPSLETIGYEAFIGMYGDCAFNMSDDGTTLNFAFPTPPITTTGDDPQTYATAYSIADWMGNTNGFTEP